MIELTDSVRSFLQDHDIATAVNTLLSSKQTTPAGLNWDELPAYYRAIGAAYQVKVEYTIAQESYWHAFWDEAVHGMAPVSIDEQLEWKSLPSFDEVWEDGTIDRCFKLSDDQWLYTSAGFDRNGACLLAKIDNIKLKTMLSHLTGFKLSISSEWVLLDAGKVTDAGTLSSLREGAKRVVAVTQALRVS